MSGRKGGKTTLLPAAGLQGRRGSGSLTSSSPALSQLVVGVFNLCVQGVPPVFLDVFFYHVFGKLLASEIFSAALAESLGNRSAWRELFSHSLCKDKDLTGVLLV